jgi:transposase
MEMGKKKLPKIKQINLTRKKTEEFLGRVKARTLAEEDYGLIEAMTETLECLSQALEEKNSSIKKLLRYLFGASTETAENVLHKEAPKQEKEKKPRPKGHGRNGAASYTGAERVKIENTELKPGDPCPECEQGKVYKLAMPAVIVNITGMAPLNATVYEMERLRCNLCGTIFTATPPEDASPEKYDDSATVMVALLKYGCGMPFHRLAKLQDNMGMPVPASTQWELLDASVGTVSPVFKTLCRLAAQGDILHNDDTTMKILDELRSQDPESTRKGIFTSGVVSIYNEHKIALFMTGHNHAGENLEKILEERDTGLPPPLQMCDGAKLNIPKNLKTILCNCLTHGRRQFVDVVEAFPEECHKVIELIGQVYHHDDLAKDQGLGPEERLSLHQEKSGPVMAELETWCRRQIEEHLVEPNSGLGNAIKYMLDRWKALTRFLHIPGAPLDNGICERALKMTVLNRKNSYFYKTLRGAYVGDVFMSIIHTCQLAGVNPFDYLTALIKNAAQVAKNPERWLPWNYTTNPSYKI